MTVTSTSRGSLRYFSSKRPSSAVGRSTRLVTSSSSASSSGTRPPTRSAQARQLLGDAGAPSVDVEDDAFAFQRGEILRGVLDRMQRRVERTQAARGIAGDHVGVAKRMTASPCSATNQRIGREKAILLAFQRIDLGNLSAATTPGSASASTSTAGRPVSRTVATT